MKYKICIFFILIFNFFNIFSQTNNYSALDYYNLAKTEFENENWYNAYQYLLETIEKNKDFQDAYFMLAQCSYQLNEFDLTLDFLEKAEKYFQNDSKIQNLRGMTYISLGRIDEAENIFDSILKSFPNDVNARFGKAELFLLNGKYSAAENEYNQALFRDATNRKALLSLALLQGEQKNYQKAQEYVQKAIAFYAGDADVYYYLSVLYAMQNNYKDAEKSIHLALELSPNNDRFYELLSTILFNLKKYSEVIDICDYRISHDRNKNSAWFLKGFSEFKTNLLDKAIETWSMGLQVFPDDEIMRSALELLIKNSVNIEDSRRKNWAEYHIENALEYDRRFDVPGSVFEYQRALKIDPFNVDAREKYAQMLNLNGFQESYLEQLKFIQENSENNPNAVKIADSIESYNSLLENSLSNKWKVDQFYLDKNRYKIGIFYNQSTIPVGHVENNFIAANYFSDIMTGINQSVVTTFVSQTENFSEAYRMARKNNCDFFITVNLDEGFRDITLSSSFYVARTGTKIQDFSFYNTGNNRYSTVFRRFKNSLFELLPIRGKILNREGNLMLVDLGKTDGIVVDSVFDVVKKSAVSISSNSANLTYKDYDKLGTIKITEVGEEISEGILEYSGLYDKTNTSDEIVLISKPQEENSQNNSVQNAGSTNNNSENQKIINFDELKIKSSPSFIDLIRGI